MKKLFLTLGLVAIVATSATAQTLVRDNFGNDQLGTYSRVTRYGPYMTNRFFDNWFIGIAGGVNYWDGTNGTPEPRFGDRLAPAADFYLGKWITPSVGMRLGYNGLKAKGANPIVPVTSSNFRDFNMMFIHADFLWNLSNAVGGFRFDRTWDLVPFMGFGYARAWRSNVEQNMIAGTMGLLNNFRLGNVIDLTLEGRWMLVDGRFDGFSGSTKRFGSMFSVTAGLTFKLGPKGGFKRPVYNAPQDCTPYQNRINSLEGDLARDRATIDRLNRENQELRNRPVEIVKAFIPVTISTFFGIGNTQVSERERVNIRHAADAMKALPNNAFTVRGYADSATGSPARNQYLSEQRAENVAKILVEYGVPRSQITVIGMGGVANNKNIELDRVAVTIVME